MKPTFQAHVANVGRGEAIYILLDKDRLENLGLVDVLGEWQLHEDRVHLPSGSKHAQQALKERRSQGVSPPMESEHSQGTWYLGVVIELLDGIDELLLRDILAKVDVQ